MGETNLALGGRWPGDGRHGMCFCHPAAYRAPSRATGVFILAASVGGLALQEARLRRRRWAKMRLRQPIDERLSVQDERIPIGPGRIYRRKAGTVIDTRRESLEDLERLKQQMSELFFSAQYQQEPIPLAGNIIKAEWFKEYEITPAYSNNDLLIISLDTAMKGTPLADYSVATIWLARGDHSYLLALWRERVDYPELRRAVSRLPKKYAGAALLVEDKGSAAS